MWRKSWFPPFHRTPINITVCKCLWHNFDFTALNLMPLTVPCLSACKMPEMGKSSSSTEKPTSDSDTENRRSIAMGKHAAKCTRRFYPMTFARFDLIWHQWRWRWNRIVGGISIWRWLNMCVLMLLRRFAHSERHKQSISNQRNQKITFIRRTSRTKVSLLSYF